MDYLKEGLDKLVTQDIPFSVVSTNLNHDCIAVPEKHQNTLRELGFRVGKGFKKDEKLIFYKGNFFGLTTG